MREIRITTVMVALVLVFSAAALADNTILHEFAGGGEDGRHPLGSLMLSGSMLYGMTYEGGDGDCGVVFKMNTNGNGYTHLHEFAGGGDDGKCPYGSLTLSGSTLYGMTHSGGDYDCGVVFRSNTDGSGYTNLHDFAGGNDDGKYPRGSLALSGSTLYGMTNHGGDGDYGVVFKMNTDGSGYTLLHEFAGGSDDGKCPCGSLTLSSSTLYGTTNTGGDNGRGVVFKMNTDGGGYALLHEFAGGGDDGKWPYGSLTLSGSTLYGMTSYGGDGDYGVVFKVNTDGSCYVNLHEFSGWGSDGDGRHPYGSLTPSGSTLYGMTSHGGDSDRGVVFKMNTDGTGFKLIHGFGGGSDDGAYPQFEQLALGADGLLYGMTQYGGDSDYGVIYSVVPEPASASLLLLGAVVMLRRRRRS